MWKPIITCEHAANRIPEKYRPLFAAAGDILKTHRGYDIGAADLARQLSRALATPLFIGKYSRLLADLNRHPGHRHVFSRFTAGLDADEKKHILQNYHAPYRVDIKNHVQHEIENGNKVLHLSVHSFTPILKGVVRTADIGLLYDPKRQNEKQISNCFRKGFRHNLNKLRCRRNYPYLGISDSLTTSLRKEFSDASYAGIEIEINQRLPLGTPGEWQSFKTGFVHTVRMALTGIPDG